MTEFPDVVGHLGCTKMDFLSNTLVASRSTRRNSYRSVIYRSLISLINNKLKLWGEAFNSNVLKISKTKTDILNDSFRDVCVR